MTTRTEPDSVMLIEGSQVGEVVYHMISPMIGTYKLWPESLKRKTNRVTVAERVGP